MSDEQPWQSPPRSYQEPTHYPAATHHEGFAKWYTCNGEGRQHVGEHTGGGGGLEAPPKAPRMMMWLIRIFGEDYFVSVLSIFIGKRKPIWLLTRQAINFYIVLFFFGVHLQNHCAHQKNLFAF